MGFGPFLLLALLEGLVQAAVLALTAVGLSLVFGVMRVVNIAHGAFFMLGAVLAAALTGALAGGLAGAGAGAVAGAATPLAFAAALVVAPVAVALVAGLADMAILKRLGYDPEATIVATTGILYILEQGALSLFGPEARPVAAPFELRLQLPWFGYSGYKLAVVAAAAAVLAAVWLLLARSRAGLVMRATRIDRETARAFGINVDLVYAGVFALGAGLAAVAGVLVVPIRQAHYLMGGEPLLMSFITVILGGLGSLRGTLVAALVIGLSDGVISVFFSPTLAKILATLVVATVLVVRPEGLFGRRPA